MARPDELQKLVTIDDEGSELYAQAGSKFAFDADHPFIVAGSARWAAAIEPKLAHVAVNLHDQPVMCFEQTWVDGVISRARFRRAFPQVIPTPSEFLPAWKKEGHEHS